MGRFDIMIVVGGVILLGDFDELYVVGVIVIFLLGMVIVDVVIDLLYRLVEWLGYMLD